MREKIHSRISNPVVANEIASFTRPVGNARSVVVNAIISHARGIVLNAANAMRACNAVKIGDRFSPRENLRLVFKVGRIKNDPKWGLMVEPDIMKFEDDWYSMDEIVMLNSSNAANAVATNRAPAGRVWSVHVT